MIEFDQRDAIEVSGKTGRLSMSRTDSTDGTEMVLVDVDLDGHILLDRGDVERLIEWLGEVLHDPAPVVTLDQFVDLTTNHQDEILAGMTDPNVIEVAQRLADEHDRRGRQAAYEREMDQMFGPNDGMVTR